MESEFDILQRAAEQLSEMFGEAPPVGVVLGSALGGLVEALEDREQLPYPNIQGWLPSTVEGHAGELLVGRMDETRCAMLSGRSHLYEGYTAAEVVRHVRTLRLWGVGVLVLTNAAGGIWRGTQPGELMIITDHLNLTGTNPLVGRQDARISTRFPDSTFAWDPSMVMILKRAFTHLGIPRREGVYAGVLGPTFETPAEVDMLALMRANAVGMSTVLENIAFRVMPDKTGQLGQVCGVSMLANAAAGRGAPGVRLDHKDITAACQLAAPKLIRVLNVAIPLMADRLT